MKRQSTTTTPIKLKSGTIITVQVEKRSLGPVKNVARFVRKNKMVAH